jgi:hypothetical protein
MPVPPFRHPPGRAKRGTGGPSGAEGDLFTQAVWTTGAPDSFALPRAAGSPGLRRDGAACRRMTKGMGATRLFAGHPHCTIHSCNAVEVMLLSGSVGGLSLWPWAESGHAHIKIIDLTNLCRVDSRKSSAHAITVRNAFHNQRDGETSLGTNPRLQSSSHGPLDSFIDESTETIRQRLVWMSFFESRECLLTRPQRPIRCGFDVELMHLKRDALGGGVRSNSKCPKVSVTSAEADDEEVDRRANFARVTRS